MPKFRHRLSIVIAGLILIAPGTRVNAESPTHSDAADVILVSQKIKKLKKKDGFDHKKVSSFRTKRKKFFFRNRRRGFGRRFGRRRRF